MQAAGFDNGFMSLLPLGSELSDFLVTGIIQLFDFGFYIATEDNIGTATGHIGGDGDRPWTPSFNNNIGFTLVLFSIQYIVFNPSLFQHLGEQLGGFHRGGAHQHWSALLGNIGDIFDYCFELFFLGQKHQVI